MGNYIEETVNYLLTVAQAFSVASFLCQYMIPVSVFAFCYGRIFYTIRRQRKVFSGHMGRGQNIAMAAKSRDQNAAQVQQQAAGTTISNKLSRIELNVIKTMITVVAVFIMFWTAPAVNNLLTLLGVSSHYNHVQYISSKHDHKA